MRLWSIHPKYLDTKGLLAVWREGLLAKKVLLGKTKGYKNHPQLIRFKQETDPLKKINLYLLEIFKEAKRRGYDFSEKKIKQLNINYKILKTDKILITKGQLKYEFNHLLKKLKRRDFSKYKEIKNIKKIKPHPLFIVKNGPIAAWEKTKR